jgi:NADPH:quinone reductase-like Zn-dependent oxidoreductase
LLNKSKVKTGDEILINGASGGVGMIALQLAKIKGLKVTVVASGEGLNFIKNGILIVLLIIKKKRLLIVPISIMQSLS